MPRALAIARLDALQVGLWDKALAGDPAASMAVVGIIEQRARLYGLIVRSGPLMGRPPES